MKDILKALIEQDEKIIDDYFLSLEEILFKKERIKYHRNRQWHKDSMIPAKEGVYIIFKENIPLYVGETACLYLRMKDIYDTRNHTIRRRIAEIECSKNDGYIKPSSRNLSDDKTEAIITKFMERMEIAYLELKLGRIEFEDYLMEKYQPKYNKKTKRKM